MKRYNVVYYILFLAVVMGAFASMAQNSYGMKLIGLVCLGFCFTFLYEVFFLAGVIRPEIAKLIGPAGFVFLFGFIVILFLFRNRIFEGEKLSLLTYIRRMKNKSGLLLIGFTLMFLFFGLNQADILPPLYS